MTVIREPRSDELDAAADVLAIAFADYAWTRPVIPAHDYGARLRELQRLYLRHAHRHGLVLVGADDSERIVGVVASLPPDAPPPAESTIERIVHLHGDRIGAVAAATTAEADAQAWRLETLGVLPDAQGHGLGGALVSHVCEQARGRGAARVALETSDERNVRLYERHGFRVEGQREVPEGPPVWRMASHEAHRR